MNPNYSAYVYLNILSKDVTQQAKEIIKQNCISNRENLSQNLIIIGYSQYSLWKVFEFVLEYTTVFGRVSRIEGILSDKR